MYPKDKIKLPSSHRLVSDDVEMKWVKKIWPNICIDRYQENYAMLTHFDDNLGRILETLDKTGIADNTIVAFMSDHGTNLGENGVMGKENLYELTLRAPLILRGPGMASGKRIHTRVYLQDIMPTLLELGQAKIPDHVEFKSLLSLIENKQTSHYKAIYGAFKDRMRCIVMNDLKLIRYYKPEGKVDRLYDLTKDPDETNDLAQNPAYSKSIGELQGQLIKSAQKYNDPIGIGAL